MHDRKKVLRERNFKGEKQQPLKIDRPIVFGLSIILRKYLTTGKLARAQFETVSGALTCKKSYRPIVSYRYVPRIGPTKTDGRSLRNYD
jgi:hypothetical protein